MPATLNTSFASGYLSECYPPEPFATTATRQGRACLKLIDAHGSSDDLAFAAYLVWKRLGEYKADGFDYVADDYIIVGEVTDMVTDADAELLVQIDPAVRKRVTGVVGGMTIEVSAVHDLLLEMSAALTSRWAEKEEGA